MPRFLARKAVTAYVDVCLAVPFSHHFPALREGLRRKNTALSCVLTLRLAVPAIFPPSSCTHAEGLRRKDSALKAMKKELEYLKSTTERMIALEGELAASNTHLLAMNQEVERARAASRRIE
jgi:hypothetical protein